MTTSGIYRFVVRRPGRPDLFYVGQAVNLDRRDRDHFRHLRGNRHDNQRLQALFVKYGEAAFSFEVLLVCQPTALLHYEQVLLDFYIETFGRRVLNICRYCAVTSAGTKRSTTVRARISEAKKGKPGRHWSLESRAKLSAKKRGILPSSATIAAVIAANTGRTQSEETRAKRSAALVGRVDSPETRAKKSAAARRRSPETRAKLSHLLRGNKNGLGRVFSAESRQKMSAAAIAREARKHMINSVDHVVVAAA